MADAVELSGGVDALGVAEWIRRGPARLNFVVGICGSGIGQRDARGEVGANAPYATPRMAP